MNEKAAAEIVNQLYDSWYQRLVSYASHVLGAIPAGEDVVQESFLELHRQLLKGINIENPRAWTFAVVRREVSKSRRSYLQREHLHDSLDILEFSPRGQNPPISSGHGKNELDRLLEHLTQREREVLLLRFEGLKYREIAQHLGISVGSVATLLTRALRKLQVQASPFLAGVSS